MLTFLIFQVIPNGDPALASAGAWRTATTIAEIRQRVGFDKPIYVQYVKTMKQIFTGQVVSYSQGVNVIDSIRQGLPATLSLAIGAGIIWLFFGVLFGVITAVKAGRFADRVLTVLAFVGVSCPPFFLGALAIYYLGCQPDIIPLGGYVPFTHEPVAVVLPPDRAVVRAVGAVHRDLLEGPALDDPRHDQRGLRAHCARQGSVRAPGARPPRAA